MKDKQAEQILDQLHYISGQLQGIAVLTRLNAEKARIADPEKWSDLADRIVPGPGPGAEPEYKSGYHAVVQMISDGP